MSFANLKNNAMFLSCWYERSRPVQLICFGIMISSILFLSFLTISTNQTKPEQIAKTLYYVIVWIQILVFVVQGSMFASNMGSRERTSETLDFHRNSPQPVADKIVGLVFGSTWFEWAIFFAFFIVELPFALLPDLQLHQILLTNLSLAMSGLFFQTTAATVSMLSTQKKRGNSLIMLLLFLWFGGPMFMFLVTAASMFFAHLFGVTVLEYMYPDQQAFRMTFQGWFFMFDLPLIVMQFVAQAPLWALMVLGLRRIYSMPNSPAWSKEDVIRFSCFMLFMITGFFAGECTHIEEVLANKTNFGLYSHTLAGFLKHEITLYSALYLAIGILICFFCVPSYFKRSKYKVLSGKGLIKRSIFNDGATSFPTILIYISLGCLFALPYLIAMDKPRENNITYFLLLNSYIVAFAGFLEFFRLGRFRHNRIFLITCMVVWWVFLPWLFGVLSDFKMDQTNLASISPFYGFSYAVSLLTEFRQPDMTTLLIPGFMAAVMWILAAREH